METVNNISNNAANHNDEIDLKDVFRTILRYRSSILFITFLFFIGSIIFAYYKPNIYASSASIEVLDSDGPSFGSSDMMKAFGGSSSEIENEVAVINSRFVIQKALESLDLTTRYFVKNRLNKVSELYKNSPIIVNIDVIDKHIYGKSFELVPIDKNTFTLTIQPLSIYNLKSILAKLGLKKLESKDKINYNKVHKYGEDINTPWFKLRVNKINKCEAPQYSFYVLPKDNLSDVYAVSDA